MNENLEKQQGKKLEDLEQTYGKAPELDLSKIKNIKAAKGSLDKEFVEKVETNTKKQKKNKFCFTEEQEVQLPTNGLLYQDSPDEDLRNGIIKIRPMSLADEEILANQSYIKNGSVFTHLLEDCVTSNFDVRKLTSYDVYYLIYTLRRITYGDDYNFEITCPECGKKFPYTLNVSDIVFEELEPGDEVKAVKTIQLPVSKYTATIRYEQSGDEEEIYRLRKNPANEDFGDQALALSARTIALVDDDGEPVMPKDFPAFYTALPGMDRAEITKAFSFLDVLKIPKLTALCPKCGEDIEDNIPFNKEFFRY